jgi:hypothetical protein
LAVVAGLLLLLLQLATCSHWPGRDLAFVLKADCHCLLPLVQSQAKHIDLVCQVLCVSCLPQQVRSLQVRPDLLPLKQATQLLAAWAVVCWCQVQLQATSS